MRDRLIELLNAYPCMSTAEDCFIESISADLADYLLANGVVVMPCKVGDMVDKFFSHNTIIALWYENPTDKRYSDMLWCDMAWNIPENYKSLPFVKFMGIVAESIDKSDTLNIKVKLTREEAEKALKGGAE